jgi:putative two-component system response regulator
MAKVLVIDDDDIVRGLMLEILSKAGYEAVGASTPTDGLGRLDDPEVSIVVSDVIMPGMSGLELLGAVRERRPSLPVVLVTGAGTHGHLTDALDRGADGFVAKPFSHAELCRAVARALDRAGRTERDLTARVLTPTLAGALANAIEARDLGMDGHCERLSELAAAFAARLGLPPAEIENVRLGAILHDIGKIGIPDRILLKPGPLTDEEREVLRTHPLIGDRLLESLEPLASARPVVRHHHERWDGAGYPFGLAGEDVPLAARIVSVADAVEAMSARRPYRDPLAACRIVAELRDGRGGQWDPAVVDVALEMIASGEIEFQAAGFLMAGHEPAERGPVNVLLVAADAHAAALVTHAIETAVAGATVVRIGDLAAAGRVCAGSTWSVAVLDTQLPDGRALELLDTLRRAAPHVPVVLLTTGEAAIASEAERHGAAVTVVKSNGYLDELTGRVRALLQGKELA